MWPPPEAVAVIAALDRPAVDGLRWTTEDQWHVTLRFLGECDLDDGRRELDRLDGAPAATAVPAPATGRFDQRILHIRVDGLDPLAAAVRGADDAPPFRGHITLARAHERRGVDLRPLAGVAVAVPPWAVDEVTLVASELHPDGARYEVVGRKRLGH